MYNILLTGLTTQLPNVSAFYKIQDRLSGKSGVIAAAMPNKNRNKTPRKAISAGCSPKRQIV